jgi:hypothetical protein
MSWLTSWTFRKYERAQEQSRRNQIAWLESLTLGIFFVHSAIDSVECVVLTLTFHPRKTARGPFKTIGVPNAV